MCSNTRDSTAANSMTSWSEANSGIGYGDGSLLSSPPEDLRSFDAVDGLLLVVDVSQVAPVSDLRMFDTTGVLLRAGNLTLCESPGLTGNTFDIERSPRLFCPRTFFFFFFKSSWNNAHPPVGCAGRVRVSLGFSASRFSVLNPGPVSYRRGRVDHDARPIYIVTRKTRSFVFSLHFLPHLPDPMERRLAEGNPGSEREAGDIELPSHLVLWKLSGYKCPSCSAIFSKWGQCSAHWREVHSSTEGELTAKDCRLRGLRAATGIDEVQTHNIAMEMIRLVSESDTGSVSFRVRSEATASELALFWEVATSIDLFCEVRGCRVFIQTEAFSGHLKIPHDTSVEDALLAELEGSPELSSEGPKRTKKRKKKKAFLREVSETVKEISVEQSATRAKARTAATESSSRKKFPRVSECSVQGAWRGRVPSTINRSDASSRRSGPRGMDNRPAWQTMAPPSAPALPITSGKGFEMLRRLGWNADSGLGKQEQGIRTPIEAHQQQFRKGLGL